MLVHQHTILIGQVNPGNVNCDFINRFLFELVGEIKMQILFEPIAIKGKYGFTGVVGIVTSHIAFHYFEKDRTLQLDVYSCKKYNLKKLTKFIDKFWSVQTAEVLFIERQFNRTKKSNIKYFEIKDHKLQSC